MKKSLLFVIVPLVAVLTLGTMNVVKKARWRDVTDGVTWRVDESGLRAIRVDPDSEAFLRAGIRTGDVLTAINKVPVKTKIDVLKGLWQAAATDQSVTYDINKEGMQIYPTFYPQRKAPNPIYYYLVLVGVMTLWLGLMKVAEEAGLVELLARAARPALRRLFPGVPAGHPALGAMVMNVAANMLGLGNAATPFGLRAMEALDQLNPRKGTASDAQALFCALNTASVQIVPASVIALRAAAGARQPADVLGATLLASACATAVALLSARLLRHLFPLPDPPPAP